MMWWRPPSSQMLFFLSLGCKNKRTTVTDHWPIPSHPHLLLNITSRTASFLFAVIRVFLIKGSVTWITCTRRLWFRFCWIRFRRKNWWTVSLLPSSFTIWSMEEGASDPESLPDSMASRPAVKLPGPKKGSRILIAYIMQPSTDSPCDHVSCKLTILRLLLNQPSLFSFFCCVSEGL